MTLEVFSNFDGSVTLCSGTCRLWANGVPNMHRGAVMRQAEPCAGTFAPSLSIVGIGMVPAAPWHLWSPSQMVRVKGRLALNPALPPARMFCNTREKNLKGQIPPGCNVTEFSSDLQRCAQAAWYLNMDVFKGINV